MNKKKTKIFSLCFNIALGVIFLSFFLLNITVFVHKNGNNGNPSFTPLIALGENTGTLHTSSNTLIDPPTSSLSINFSGGQNCSISLHNNDVLGVVAGVTCNFSNPFGATWQAAMSPFGSASKVYSDFDNIPIGYRFTVSDLDDPANIGIIVASTY